MKITRIRAFELNHILSTTDFALPMSARFRYAVSQNIRITKEEIDATNEAFPVSDAYKEFLQKRQEIFTAENITSDEQFATLDADKKSQIELKIKELVEANKEIISEAEEIEKERTEFLKEEIELALKTVKVDDVPVITEKNKYPHWDIWNIVETIVVE